MSDLRTPRYDAMQYARCGRSGLKLPRISLGLWHNFGTSEPYANARGMLLRAFELGITHFDLANNYGPPPGSAEQVFGQIFAADLAAHRDEIIVSTKAGYDMWAGPYGNFGSRKHVLASLDQSLRRLGLDYVDVFYHHRPDPETPLEETMGALDQAVRSGRALYVGLSKRAALRKFYAHSARPVWCINPNTACWSALRNAACSMCWMNKALVPSCFHPWPKVA
jgi:L-glyceraldehyde 3-phosphate reductase